MLFCPYCLRRQERSGEESFTDVAGFRPTDTPNQKKMMLKIHSLGCGRVFIAVYDIKKGEYMRALGYLKKTGLSPSSVGHRSKESVDQENKRLTKQ